MSSISTTVKSVRVPNVIGDWWDVVDGRRVVEGVYELIQSGAIVYDGENLVVQGSEAKNFPENKKAESDGIDWGIVGEKIEELRRIRRELKAEIDQKDEEIEGLRKSIEEKTDRLLDSVPRKVLEDLESMALTDGIGLSELLIDLHGKLLSGAVGLSGGISVGVVDECPFNWRVIVEACDEMGRGYEETAETVAKMIYSGRI